MKRFVLLAVLVLGILLTLVFVRVPFRTVQAQSLTSFADCLRDKGATMYGVDWCPYCRSQKRMFGEAFSRIPYVNCDFQEADCKANMVSSYPLWIIQGKRLVGAQPLTALAQSSGCTLPSTS